MTETPFLSPRDPAPARPQSLWLMAAIVVATGFLFNFVARGVVDTFMVFVLPIEAEFGFPRSSITGVYSFYLITVGLMSPVSGLLLDRLGPRATYGLGLLLLALAMWIGSMATALWHFYLATGILCGIAAALLGMVPASALISRWYDKKLSVAIGIAYAGFGSGILVIVPLAQVVVDAMGWRQAYQGLGFAVLCLFPVILLFPWRRIAAGRTDMPPVTREQRKAGSQQAHWTIRLALRTPEFWLLVQVFFFTACAVYSLVIQTIPYLVENGYPPIEAAVAFGATGLLSIGGVMTAGVLCARYGNRFTATLSFAGTLLGAMALLGFAFWNSSVLILIWIVAFGISQGARGPIVSTITARIFAQGSVASIFGTIFMTMSFGSATGSWVSGFLHDWTGDYRATFLFSGLCVILAAAPFWVSDRLNSATALAPPDGGASPWKRKSA